MSTNILRFVNLILAALLAGTSFGIWMGLKVLDRQIFIKFLDLLHKDIGTILKNGKTRTCLTF